MWFLLLLTVYGIAFLIYNRMTVSEHDPKVLGCIYCLGFWVGWIVWVLAWLTGIVIIEGIMSWIGYIVGGFMWSFACSAFCYIADSILCWMEEV